MFDKEPAWLNRLEKRGKSFINVFSISYVYVHCTCYCSVSAFNHITNENFNVTRLRSCHILKLQGKPHQRREGDIDTATGHHWAAGGNVLRFIQLANHLISLPPSLSACHSVSQGRRKKTAFFTFSKKNWDPPSPFFDHLSFLWRKWPKMVKNWSKLVKHWSKLVKNWSKLVKKKSE